MFYSSDKGIDEAVDALNDRYIEGEFLTLNDFYHHLGISKTDFGESYGSPWVRIWAVEHNENEKEGAA